MNTTNPECLVCKQDSQHVPLLRLEYQDQFYWICPQHFPILIHEPEQLIGTLPGAEHLTGHQH